ncbi:MAG: adenosylcobinamide-GDP ribazoletransferase [Proteobacteria bacterium]|nr:adenosylcobinamide-GDP ribazoletransferase [Pseudomonadota bacterium]
MNGLGVRALRAGFVFLTRVPVGGFPYSEREWKWAAASFPAVGACVGLVMATAWLAAAPVDPVLGAFAAVGAGLLATGALHEDGLADTADALGGAHGDRARLFEILKDSRVGSYGALAIAFSIGVRVALLTLLDERAPGALVLSQALSRLPPLVLLAGLPYATPPNAARSGAVVRGGPLQAGVGLLLALGVLGGWALWTGAFWTAVEVLVGLALVTLAAGAYFRHRVGGVTGDLLGAVQQVSEWLVLIAVLRSAGA